MNGKKAKRLRKMCREMGFLPGDTQYETHTSLHKNPVTSDVYERQLRTCHWSSGRAYYQKIKEGSKHVELR